MSDISMIGLGRMGAAVAEGLLSGGRDMTVWNRSAEKMQPFIERGALGASSIADAVAASQLIVICIDNYSVTHSLLDVNDVTDRLSDRIVVQLSTGTPDEAGESAEWFKSFGAEYIDGAILGGPENLHTDSAQVLFAGAEDTYMRVEHLLQSVCPRVRYVGEKIRGAAVLDMAWLCRHYGMFAGVTHGALLCEAENMGLDLYSELFPESDYAHFYVKTMLEENFYDTPATLRIWAGALEAIRKHAVDCGINSEAPTFFASQFEKALKAGYGEEDVAALIKVLRNSS